jgi:hypothetical protein
LTGRCEAGAVSAGWVSRPPKPLSPPQRHNPGPNADHQARAAIEALLFRDMTDTGPGGRYPGGVTKHGAMFPSLVFATTSRIEELLEVTDAGPTSLIATIELNGPLLMQTRYP